MGDKPAGRLGAVALEVPADVFSVQVNGTVGVDQTVGSYDTIDAVGSHASFEEQPQAVEWTGDLLARGPGAGYSCDENTFERTAVLWQRL